MVLVPFLSVMYLGAAIQGIETLPIISSIFSPDSFSVTQAGFLISPLIPLMNRLMSQMSLKLPRPGVNLEFNGQPSPLQIVKLGRSWEIHGQTNQRRTLALMLHIQYPILLFRAHSFLTTIIERELDLWTGRVTKPCGHRCCVVRGSERRNSLQVHLIAVDPRLWTLEAFGSDRSTNGKPILLG